MNFKEAHIECNRWLDRLERDREKTKKLVQLASDARSGKIDRKEIDRRKREIDGISPTVYDGANLEKAVKFLLKSTENMIK